MARTTRLPFRAAVLACACAMLAASVERAAGPDAAPVRVRVERVRPRREPLPTMRFLRTNREFLRSRLDQLRETPLTQGADAQAMDPRFLAWREMLAGVQAAGDTVAAAADADQRRELFASVTDLGRMESQLDAMDAILAAQRARLASLQEDFAGHQRTALAVVVSGWPRGEAPGTLTLALEDGTRCSLPLTANERASLSEGGVLELFHGLVEPREQSLAIALPGAAADSGFVTLTPPRDRLTFLRLDLSALGAGAGASAIAASTWVHDDDAPTPAGDAPRP